MVIEEPMMAAWRAGGAGAGGAAAGCGAGRCAT